MRIEFWTNPETGQPHVLDHGVLESEAREVLNGPKQDRPGRDGAIVALGPTAAGRILKVVYRSRADGSVLVITAFDAPKGSKKLYRRYNRKKK